MHRRDGYCRECDSPSCKLSVRACVGCGFTDPDACMCKEEPAFTQMTRAAAEKLQTKAFLRLQGVTEDFAGEGEPCPVCGALVGIDRDGYFCPGCMQSPTPGDQGCTCKPPLQPGETWVPVDLAAVIDEGCTDPAPVLLAREDGARLLYEGKTHTIAGESESLKTWFALLGAVEVLNGDGTVLFIDYEDTAPGIVGRLLALGCPKDAIVGRFLYVRPDEPYGPVSAVTLKGKLAGRVPQLVVIDGITEAMAAHGLDPNSNVDVATFNAKLPNPMATAGAAVASIDHVTKSKETRGRYAIGAQHKLSAVSGAAYIVELIKPFGHGQHGMAKIIISKDRPGRVREHGHDGVAGIMHLRSEEDGSVLAEIRPGREFQGEQENTTFRPTVLMERISDYCQANPKLTKTALITGTAGNSDHKKLALELLILEGHIVTEPAGRALLHSVHHPFRMAVSNGQKPLSDPDPLSDPI